LLADTGSLLPRPNPGGRSATLTPREIKKLETFLIKNPTATNAELAALVDNKITPRSAGNYISKSSLEFTKKLEGVDVEVSFTPKNAEECRAFLNQIKRIPFGKREYVDETFASSGVRRKIGRYPKGKSGWLKQNRKYCRMTIVSAITQEGLLHPSKVYDKGSITTLNSKNMLRKSCARV
jgi:hypothetical protein